MVFVTWQEASTQWRGVRGIQTPPLLDQGKSHLLLLFPPPPPFIYFCSLACQRGWSCTRILVWENETTFLRTKKGVGPPPPPPPPPLLSDFFRAGAGVASRPADNCKTPPLRNPAYIRHCLAVISKLSGAIQCVLWRYVACRTIRGAYAIILKWKEAGETPNTITVKLVKVFPMSFLEEHWWVLPSKFQEGNKSQLYIYMYSQYTENKVQVCTPKLKGYQYTLSDAILHPGKQVCTH